MPSLHVQVILVSICSVPRSALPIYVSAPFTGFVAKAGCLLFSSCYICNVIRCLTNTFLQSRDPSSSLKGRLTLTGVLLLFQMQKEESKDKRRRRRSDE